VSVSAGPLCRDRSVDFRAACTVFLPEAAPPAMAMKMLGAIAAVVVGRGGVELQFSKKDHSESKQPPAMQEAGYRNWGGTRPSKSSEFKEC